MWTKICNDPKLAFGGSIFATSHTTFRKYFFLTLDAYHMGFTIERVGMGGPRAWTRERIKANCPPHVLMAVCEVT